MCVKYTQHQARIFRQKSLFVSVHHDVMHALLHTGIQSNFYNADMSGILFAVAAVGAGKVETNQQLLQTVCMSVREQCLS